MAESAFLTGQYVQIRQTPASVGERIGAQLIDWLIQGIFLYTFLYLFAELGGKFDGFSQVGMIITVLLITCYSNT